MKNTLRMIIATILTLLSVSHAGESATIQPIPEMESVLAKVPWESKALTPVKMSSVKGVQDQVFFDKGQALLPIVIPAKSKPEAAYCKEVAIFLQGYLKRATGATFEIVNDDTSPLRGIFVGPCDYAGMSNFSTRVTSLKPENFLVSSFAGGIALIGSDISDNEKEPLKGLRVTNRKQSKGTFFAAVDFLERFVGVRFYMPGEIGIYIPYCNNQTLSMPAVSYTDGPVFKLRLSSYGSYLTKDHKLLGYTKTEGRNWMHALRMADFHRLKSGHTDGRWHKFYAKDHPDWFALRRDGSRMVGKRGKLSVQRCYTNEEAFQEHLRSIQHYYDTGEGKDKFIFAPNSKYIYWWPNDGFGGCHCKNCMALTDLDKPRGSRLARLIWGYTAKLGREIKKRWPDKILVASYYSRWSDGPGDIELPDNVTFMLVETREAYHKEPALWQCVTQEMQANMNTVKVPVAIWSHYPHRPRIGNRLDAPYLAPHTLKRYVQWLQEKSSGVYLNGHYTSSFALDGHVIYLYKKLLWNPEIDVDAVLEEYCRVMFGPAAPQVAEYYKRIINAWEKTQWKDMSAKELQSPHKAIAWPRYYKETYPRAMRIDLKDLLAKALTNVKPGTPFYARTEWLVKGTEIFFSQGELLDSGTMLSTECTSMTPKIDGELDEWKNVKPLLMKNNINAKEVSVRTKVFTGYDAKNFYVAIHAFEPDEVKAPAAGQIRDFPMWKHDSVELFLCTEQPGLKEAGLSISDQYHQIIIGPNGNIFDGYRARGTQSLDSTVNIEFTHSTKKTADGYVVEMAIPYKSLNALVPTPGSNWMVNFYRNRKRKGKDDESLHSWSPTLASAHNTARFGTLIFPTKVVWHSDFSNFEKQWLVKTYRDDINVTPVVKEGRLTLHVSSNKMDAKENMSKSPEIKIKYLPAKRPIAAPLAAPIRMDWRFRFDGTGLVRARAHAGSKEGGLGHYIYRPKIYKDTGWIVGADDKKGAGLALAKLDYCFFALKVGPLADFNFELDYIRVRECASIN
jgi:uncharacterized protein DUF4838/cellulose/xylan binding protein with CBM9 domain